MASATAPGKLPPPQMIASGSCPAVTTVALDASGCIALVILRRSLDAGAHQRPLAAGADECNDLLHQGIVGEFLGDVLDSMGEYTRAKKQGAIRPAQPVQIGAGRATAPQADDVEAIERCDLSLAKPERNKVGAICR